MTHACHAFECKRAVTPGLFMCAYHWRIVPATLKSRIWANYTKGQCETWQLVARKYADAACEAIRAVAATENKHMTGDEAELRLYELVTGTSKQPGLF